MRALILGFVVAGWSTAALAQAPSADDINRIAKIVGKGRYMESPQCGTGQSPATHRCCQTVAETDPLMATVLAPYRDFRVAATGHSGLRDCRYASTNDATHVTLETRAIMLNPTPQRVAEWTIAACRNASARALDDCAKWAWNNIFSESGTQFAVTGPVVEPNATNCRSDGKPQPSDVGYTFRDGVTVKLKNVQGVCDGDKNRLKSEPSLYFADDVEKTTSGGPSRVTMVTRQSHDHFFGGGVPGREPDSTGVIPWLKLVREAHMAALGATSHAWLEKRIMEELPASKRNPPP